MKAGVIGHPIAHSKSPIIHQYWMRQYGVEGSYELFDILPEDLSVRVGDFIDKGFDGFNVTIPHKQAMMTLCDELDEATQKIGAVNTVVIQDKKLLGRNTDSFGFIQNIKSSNQGFDFHEKKIMVLGAGGAARAIIYGLINRGVKSIKLSNRTIEKAQELQKIAPDMIEVIPWDEREGALENVDLLVNSTALGMDGKPALEMDLQSLPQGALVNDIVYAPLMTDLLKQALARGNPIVTGIGMLLHQARPAFESWTGILPEISSDIFKTLERNILK